MTSIFKFVRFVVPASLFCFWVYLGIWSNSSLDNMLPEINEGGALSVVSGITFVSVLGYFISAIYRYIFPTNSIDHIDFVNNQILRRNIIVKGQGRNGTLEISKLQGTTADNCYDAYWILNVLWHQNKKYFDEEKTNFHADIINASGCCFVSGCLALVFFVVEFFTFCKSGNDLGIFIILFISCLCFTIFFWIRFQRNVQDYKVWFESSVGTGLERERMKRIRIGYQGDLNHRVEFFQFKGKVV